MVKLLIPLTLTTSLFYLVGAFIWSSFDTSEWDTHGKYMIGIAYLFITLIMCIGYFGGKKVSTTVKDITDAQRKVGKIE